MISIISLMAFAVFENLSLALSLSLRLIYISRKKIVAKLNPVSISIISTRFVFFNRLMIFGYFKLIFFIFEND